jgi:hypothetical protein
MGIGNAKITQYFTKHFTPEKKIGCLANSIHLSLPNFFHTNGMRVSQSSE